MYLYGLIALWRLTAVVYNISLNQTCFCYYFFEIFGMYEFKHKHMDCNHKNLRVTMHQNLVQYTAMAAILDLIKLIPP